MDMHPVLESMAQISSHSSTYADVDRWVRLFGYNDAQAESAIKAHFQDLSRILISNEQWLLIRNTSEAQGHDQESYAHYLTHFAGKLAQQQQPGPKIPGVQLQERKKNNPVDWWIVKLEGGLTAKDVQIIGALPQPPRVLLNDTGDMSYAVIETETILALQRVLPPGLTCIRLSISARKDLSKISIAPTLGVDATLPQNRCCSSPLPRQDEYPVPYFFYGTLAEPERLAGLLDLDREPRLVAATIWRGKKRSWGQYFALVDGNEAESVDGWMYVVESREHEDELRRYESCNYEVVRCEICTKDGTVSGLTFRFCGKKEKLS